eukprot:CAMPEP_0184870368 /NCGR_PEP_ID=MMETSP0580-20130426/37227_1 /TAXON_ID=1118495 /ORGANISM="Dactyliosolen fragilissimus" /LENGTH=819 /DNA_ID=CAMNT_0027372405 /DNA_START=113 /DNA_END=2572 /DNA_ORIENTATION=+
MGCNQSKGVSLDDVEMQGALTGKQKYPAAQSNNLSDKPKGSKRSTSNSGASAATSPISNTTSGDGFESTPIDYTFNFPPEIKNMETVGKQLYTLLSLASTTEDAYVWSKTVKLCQMHPKEAGNHVDPRRHDTPLHAACRAIDRSGGDCVENLQAPASPLNAIRALLRCAPDSLSHKDQDGNIPLHYCLLGSQKTMTPNSSDNDSSSNGSSKVMNGYGFPRSVYTDTLTGTNSMQNSETSLSIRSQVISMLIAGDYEASQEYLERTDVEHGCTPLYLAVLSLPDDFQSSPGPTVSLVQHVHYTHPSMLSVKNDGDHDTPLALLYRRFSRQFDLSEKFFPGDNSREEVVQFRMKYKTAAMNTWKIILALLTPSEKKRSMSDFFIVHAAVSLTQCPPDLLRYIIETRSEEVRTPDQDGRLPLHHAAASGSIHTISSNGISRNNTSTQRNKSGSKYHYKFVIDELLYSYPDGSAYSDKKGNLPLKIAVESGKTWIGGGIKSLYDVYPDAMDQLQLDNHPNIKRAMSFSSHFVLDQEPDEDDYDDNDNDDDDNSAFMNEINNNTTPKRHQLAKSKITKEEHYDAIMMVQRPDADLGDVVSAMWANEEDGGVQMLGCAAISQIINNLHALKPYSSSPSSSENSIATSKVSNTQSKNAVRSVALTAVTSVVNAMKNHPNEPAVQEKACAALHILASADNYREVSMAASGAAASIVAAMQSHVSDAIVQKEACRALASIVQYGGADRATVIASVSGFTAVQNSMGAHPDDVNVQTEACNVLDKLTAFVDANLPDLPGEQTAPLLEAAKVKFPMKCGATASRVLLRLS